MNNPVTRTCLVSEGLQQAELEREELQIAIGTVHWLVPVWEELHPLPLY